MFRVNIHDAKTHLSRYLARLGEGEVILVCRRNVPIAELRGLGGSKRKVRPFGLEKGRFRVPRNFNDPLPEAELDAWEAR